MTSTVKYNIKYIPQQGEENFSGEYDKPFYQVSFRAKTWYLHVWK